MKNNPIYVTFIRVKEGSADDVLSGEECQHVPRVGEYVRTRELVWRVRSVSTDLDNRHIDGMPMVNVILEREG